MKRAQVVVLAQALLAAAASGREQKPKEFTGRDRDVYLYWWAHPDGTPRPQHQADLRSMTDPSAQTYVKMFEAYDRDLAAWNELNG